MGPILDTLKIAVIDDLEAAGSSINSNSSIVDTAGYDGCLFLCPITDSVATGVATMTIQQNVNNSGTGMAALAGAQAQATSGTNDDINGRLLAIDVFRPRERYLRVNRTSATANIAYGDVTAILYKGRKAPVVQDATQVAGSAIAVSPAEA